MQRVSVDIPGGSYDIAIGPGAIAGLPQIVGALRPTRVLVVSDATVGSLYGSVVQRALSGVAPTALYAGLSGETDKSLPAVAGVIDALVAQRADRKSLIVALGGGVVGDIAGFAAAIFMRGIRFVQVPTTLLAQVDSSVGGKTGVNHTSGKNLIGAFHQPEAVIADTDLLKTLPPRELSAGIAEVLKHGLLADADYFDATVRDLPALLDLDAAALTRAVTRSCEIKAGVVGRDERESGERALLNFGHTFGHAIEALAGYGTWLHGEAVGCGMCLAADLSRRLGLIDQAAVDAVTSAVAQARLPVRIAGLSLPAARRAMAGDKKAEGGEIRFIVLERIGRAIQRSVPPELVDETLRAGGYVDDRHA